MHKYHGLTNNAHEENTLECVYTVGQTTTTTTTKNGTPLLIPIQIIVEKWKLHQST